MADETTATARDGGIRLYSTADGALRTAVFHLMTMPFTLRLRHADEDTLRVAAEACRGSLAGVDRTFSPFRPDSLTSRANRGDWGGLLRDPDFAEVYARASMAADLTRGHFRAMRHGRYDPVGLVKGWAIERAFDRFLRPLLDGGRAEAAVLGGGGDMQAGVRPGSDFTWGVGIEDPGRADMLAGTVRLGCGAVATSGLSKRGGHIDRMPAWDGSRSGRDPSDDVIQATVVGTHLTDADMWATTAVAAGLERFRTLTAREDDPSFAALLVMRDGHTARIHPRTPFGKDHEHRHDA
ncbi:FAD:protein FMN transferase [Bifidobacterium platyrrhinorum]|nr:FAD:protein FMN transferase [Bifidobacterium platyrrhinorum]